jgi:hypothetical protein
MRKLIAYLVKRSRSQMREQQRDNPTLTTRETDCFALGALL